MRRKILYLLLFAAPLGLYPYLRDTGVNDFVEDPFIESNKSQPRPLSPIERRACQSVASLPVLPGQAFPALLCWESLRVLGQEKADSLEDLAKRDPLAFLEECSQQYEQHVHGYRLIFVKQERVKGKLHPKERIRCCFREQPFSVHMHWLAGAGKAIRTLYVKGENKDMLLARPTIEWLGVWAKKLDSPEVTATSRFPITEFGINHGAKSTIVAMRAAEQRGALHVRYGGLECVKELGDRYCYKLIRSPYDPPEADGGINEYTIYIDAETLLHTGSVLKDSEGKLLAEYFFRDIELNPVFDAKLFTDKGL